MASKSVLVSYAGRKKVLSIDAEKQIDNLKFLTQELKKEFSFESNVNISVTF